MERPCPVLLVAALNLAIAATPSASQSMWAPSGVPLCQSGCPGDMPRIVSDGAGGAYVAWRDLRTYSTTDYDVYMQHVMAVGLIAPGWPADALPVVAFPQTQDFSGLAPDGLGGALVAWEDNRYFPGTGPDAFAQRVLADGSLPPGWAIGGNPASLAPGEQYLPQVGPDGAGGAYIVWRDTRSRALTGDDIYAQHLTASGAVAPGWPQDGLALCTAPGEQGGPYFAVPDDSGGALFEWGDGRPGAPGSYALRVHADGTLATGWPTNGLLLNGRGNLDVTRDEAGGFFAVSPTPAPAPYVGFDGAYYLQRFTFDGAAAPGWPADGVLVCNAPGARNGVQMDADGAGGVLLCWFDYRLPSSGGEIYALRVRPDGTLAPGWRVDGTLVSDPTDGMLSYDAVLVRDGQGGAYVVWQEQGGASGSFLSLVQHLTGGGQVAPGWPRYGLEVGPHGTDQFDAWVATDGQGGAIVTWDGGGAGQQAVWAQRFGPNGPTPVLLSLVSAEAKEGRVELNWYAAAGAGIRATAYRRTDHTDWLSLGSVSADGTGHLRYEDRAVAPGERYAYRLGYLEGGVEQFTAETWVEVPALALALDGLRPNPAVGEPVASFTLPNGSPARLQLLDVTGRVWLARDVGNLSAGSHLVRLGGSVPAGLYWLRLTQGGRSLLARGVVVH